LTKKYETRTILDDISSDFSKGSVTSLVGPSGGGKSTLLRCLNGLESFDAGEISIGGLVLKPGGVENNGQTLFQVRQRVGFVFQQWNLFSHKNALGNIVEAPIQVKKESEHLAVERAKSLLEKVGMSHRQNAYPSEMSGGEQQRVAIARALAMEPSVLLLDEPTSALDPERVGDVLELLQKLAKEGLTMVVVTHEMKFARDISDKVLVLHGGKIIEEGNPREILNHPKHPRTRAFLGLE